MRIGKDMKKALQEAFEAPCPVEKEKFLARIPRAQINHLEFMVMQSAYIKKRVWFISALIFCAALREACSIQKDMIWAVSAMVPFIALSMITENARSAAYGMEELEMASRFSLRSVILARAGILGIFHLLLLGLLVPVSLQNSDYTLLQTGVYLTVPYLATTVAGLAAVRRIHGKESVYVCMGIAVIVSSVHLCMGDGRMLPYRKEYFVWWMAAFIILAAALIAEWRKTMKQTEELVWNLQ